MNTTVAEGVELAKAVVEASAEVPADVKLIIAPPFTHLYPVAEVVKGSAEASTTAFASSTPSATVVFIFQLPATMCFLIVFSIKLFKNIL